MNQDTKTPRPKDKRTGLRSGLVRRRIPPLSYPARLPVSAKKDEIVRALRTHQVIVVTGETGSGKTTQIPKMCLEAGRGRRGIVGCTQPRRIAAVTVARRIAEEMGEEIGQSVGYKIRFQDRSGASPLIKIMTDGILLMETQSDPLLRAYDTIIVDEAHERNLNIDFVLGILRRLLPRRPDLKVVITSATIDTEKFSHAFGGAPIIEVSGRLYPVEVRYRPATAASDEEEGDGSHIDLAVQALDEIAAGGLPGDVLIFMPTEQDIRETCEILAGRYREEIAVLPMFARLSWPELQRVFRPLPHRKIVIATNIAETSLTIPGIMYVIDTGLARTSQYNPRSRTNGLPVLPISQSNADQRAGRCGRVRNGVCIRLYEKDDYERRPRFTPPEILRSNLAEILLRMLSLNLGEVASFPFVDPPPPKSIRDGIETLQELGAVSQRNGILALTAIGRRMARMPVDPRLSRMIIEAEKEGCLHEVTVMAAALSVADPRERPTEVAAEADAAQAVFADPTSDFLTLLAIWRRATSREMKESRGRLRRFCREHFLSYRRVREWQDIYEQLCDIVAEEGMKGRPAPNGEADAATLSTAVHRSILTGFLANIARRKERNVYEATKGRQVMIFPGSSLFNRGGNWLVAAEMVQTSRLFARTCATIDGAWLEELGGTLCRTTYAEPHWSRSRGEVVAFAQVSLFGLVIVPRRAVSYGRIDPDESARIFIQSALVAGEVARPLPFLKHNLALRENLEAIEDKMRRRGLLAGDEAVTRFYEDRLPGIYDVRTLQKCIRDKGGDAFLRMREEDLLLAEPDEDALALYPDEIAVGRCRLPLTYRFAPGEAADGVTVKIPFDLVGSVPPDAADWAVPGLYREKITALLKSLPKDYRKKLMPLAETAAIILREMPAGDGHFLSALGKFIYGRFGIDIPSPLWSAASLPEHLRLRFAVVDEGGREIAAGREFGELRKALIEEAETAVFARAKETWERDGITAWDFDTLPACIPLERGGALQGFAYPALEPTATGVRLRLFADEREAAHVHPRGIEALFVCRFHEDLVYLKKNLSPTTGEMKILAASFGGAHVFTACIVTRVTRDLFARDIRTRNAFESHAALCKSAMLPLGRELLQAALPVFRAYHDSISAVRTLEAAHRGNRPGREYLAALRGEIASLVPRDFLLRYETDRLPHLVRYLKAVTVRAERGVIHLEKAWQKTAEVEMFARHLVDMVKSVPPFATEEKNRAIGELGWMIEEYKVSLFAQELKTPYPVSRKRLEEKIREIERMA